MCSYRYADCGAVYYRWQDTSAGVAGTWLREVWASGDDCYERLDADRPLFGHLSSVQKDLPLVQPQSPSPFATCPLTACIWRLRQYLQACAYDT